MRWLDIVCNNLIIKVNNILIYLNITSNLWKNYWRFYRKNTLYLMKFKYFLSIIKTGFE